MEFCTNCYRHQERYSLGSFLDCAGRTATLCQHLCCGQNLPRDRELPLCTGVSVVVYQSDLLLSYDKEKQKRKKSLFQISQMKWMHIFQYWGVGARISHYWERLRKQREKVMHLFTPKADIQQNFHTERNFKPPQ